ncbi:unnamed protein product [Peniophora sp. CBMAI 1063]|nr:unnamed protein product [Peniophora sp. CBMAI 1063]
MTTIKSSTTLALELEDLMASGEQSTPMSLSRLGNRAFHQFTYTGDIQDVDVAIRAFANSLSLLSEDQHQAERLAMLNMLVAAYSDRFASFQTTVDLTHIVNHLRRVVDAVVSDAGAAHNRLAMALQTRFDNLGNREDVDEAIACFQRAVELAIENDFALVPVYLNNLSNALRTRFDRLDDMADLNAAISFAEKAVALQGDDSPFLNNLGACLFERFERLGDGNDIEAAATHLRRAVDFATDDEVYKPHYMHTLGTVLHKRYELSNQLDVLDDCIEVLRQAVLLTDERAIHYASLLSHLGTALCARFEALDNPQDVQDAVESHRAAVACTPDDNPDKVTWLSNMAHAFLVTFIRDGEAQNIQNAIASYRRVVSLTDDEDPSLCIYLGNLGAALSMHAEVSGRMDDLDESITLLQRALKIAPADRAEKPIWLDSLGIALHDRYRDGQDLEDLETSLLVLRSAIELTSPIHSRRARRLHNLSATLFSRYERFRDSEDIEAAIGNLREAVALTAQGSVTDQASYLSALGLAYQSRYEYLGMSDDIDSAIACLTRAVECTPDGHADKAGWLSNLGLAHTSRYDKGGRDPNDLTRAIKALTRTSELTPGAHAKQAIWHHNIAFAYQRRYEHHDFVEDYDSACAAYERAVKHVESSAFDRLRSALYWAELSSSQSLTAALPAYSHVLSLIPSVAWLGRNIGTRYEQLSHMGPAISGAAAACIGNGDVRRALEWLEQGRSVVWGQLLALRSPVDELREQNPGIAKELEDLARALQSAGAVTARPGMTSREKKARMNLSTSRSLSDEAQKHSQLAREYESTIEHVRKLPGFDRFLKPKRAEELLLAAESGPVVLINVHDSRSDALAVCKSGEIVHVPLPGLNTALVKRMHYRLGLHLNAIGVRDRAFLLKKSGLSSIPIHAHGWSQAPSPIFERILGTLWVCVVQPILSALEYALYDAAQSRIPHVTWCTTGPLAYLPLHAAGIYDGSVAMKSSDFVVSSYTPSLSTLIEARRRARGRLIDLELPRLLVVAQPNTPNQSPLPGTMEEQRLVCAHFKEGVKILNDSDATVSGVLQGMAAHPWAHLACHGMQVPRSPTESAFALHDGHLSIAELMCTDLPRAELAFLSACQTATGDVNLPDESVHLAAAMLSVGYTSVIGTIWSIGDEDAPILANAFYARVLEDIGGNQVGSRTAYALHDAVEELKVRIGEHNFAKWVPFVHYGL